jgi:hypothetical protein
VHFPETTKEVRIKDPISTRPEDIRLQGIIRRINLDALWSRASSTVERNAAKIEEGVAILRGEEVKAPYVEPGPLPFEDHCGYRVTLQVVLSSLVDKGRYQDDKQWDTVRRFKSAASKQYRAGREANERNVSVCR